MIWLASFPRSGNTFFRNVLHEVYGISSGSYHQDPTKRLNKNYASFPVVKTHLLPRDLPENLRTAKSVYILRDGRDSLVSIAHHRKDIVARGSDFYVNLLLAVLALNDSYFGGWSKNVNAWTAKADIVIRFEDLIEDPIREIEKLRAIMDLPEPRLDKLPSFQKLKFGAPKYGGGTIKGTDTSRAAKHFRRGKIGGWRDEMPPEIEALIYRVHGRTLQNHGFDVPPQDQALKPKRALVEVGKIFAPENDGVKRYLLELLEHLPFITQFYPEWTIDLYHNNRIQPLHTLKDTLIERGLSRFHEPNPVEAVAHEVFGYERILLKFKGAIKWVLPQVVYNSLSALYRKGPFRRLLKKVHRFVGGSKEIQALNEFEQQLNSYDLIHSPLPQHYEFVKHLEGQHVFTVHDLTHELFPEFHTSDNVERTAAGIQEMVRHKLPVIAISEATKADLVKLYAYPDHKIEVIYEGANGGFNRMHSKTTVAPLLKRYGLPDAPYFIVLSTIEPRKNIKRIISAFLDLKKEYLEPISLCICGKKGWKYEELFENEKELNESGIFFTGFVGDEDLRVLFAHATALCYVSLYEGFGLPILEAMQSGTPVIYGDNSSMPEVAGSGGIGVQAEDVGMIKGAMLRLLQDPRATEELGALAWQQSTKFNWLKTALETLNFYEEIISENDNR
ncbi:MAG: glycosyltransferase [Bacteroidota bacterium]